MHLPKTHADDWSFFPKVLRRDSDGICVRYRCYTYGVEYKPGDAVYIESNRNESPFYICAIQVRIFSHTYVDFCFDY